MFHLLLLMLFMFYVTTVLQLLITEAILLKNKFDYVDPQI